ncbi:MAG: hypothetical protein KF708_23000 [Pirellulales bacterium]|nr:hypothetical protein [Pirellulales bacterium]
MARRLSLAAVAVFDVAMLLAIGAVAFGYFGQRTWMNLNDQITLWTPLAVAALGLASTMWVLGRSLRAAWVTCGAVFFALQIQLVVMAAYLSSHYHLIAHDGTAYWGLMFIPCLLVGAPLLFAALMVGGSADIIRAVRRRKSDASVGQVLRT